MKKVLVSGGCGFLGSHLVDRLLMRDDVELILVVDNLWTGRTKNLAHVNDPRLDLVECSVEKYATKVRFDEIMHLASPASPPWYMREPVRVIQANVHGALNLLDHLAPQGRICYTSTSEVYGDPFVSPQPKATGARLTAQAPAHPTTKASVAPRRYCSKANVSAAWTSASLACSTYTVRGPGSTTGGRFRTFSVRR
jgi:nucleoside-diphosphate-sugar epimerase